LIVYRSIYREGDLFVNGINLVGSNGPIVDGADHYACLLLENDATVKLLTLRNARFGIDITYGNNNYVYGNTILDTEIGVLIAVCSEDNIVRGNTIKDSRLYGMEISYCCERNLIYQNNFINNNGGGIQAYDDTDRVDENNIGLNPNRNRWNSSCSFGGNYWSDMDDKHDGYKGEFQTIQGDDGIVNLEGGGIRSYFIQSPWGSGGPLLDEHRHQPRDNYPLMEPHIPKVPIIDPLPEPYILLPENPNINVTPDHNNIDEQ
jgi:parallel beta-helix repeat protein